ncbi:MAG TPA: lipopolysaccharide kinase InaA family protein [Gemmatimonadaceae bacterium]
MSSVLPDGYIALRARAASGAGLMSLRVPLETALGAGSFYAYAERAAGARALAGRGVAYAVALPGDAARVVVRRSRHGGLLAALTGDRFTAPTRAPYELDTAVRLAALGVRTPEVVAFATYPAGAFRRADVVTREIPGSADLAAVLAEPMSEDRRRAVLAAVAQLIADLTLAGARHPDLHVKNILVQRLATGGMIAYVLDVDRIWFDRPGSARVTERNIARLSRSARKWRRASALDLAETDMGWLAATAHHLALESSGAEEPAESAEPPPAAAV